MEDDKKLREGEFRFKLAFTQEGLVNLAQMFFERGVPIPEIEDAFGTKIKEVVDGKLVWESKPIRIVRMGRIDGGNKSNC